MRQRNSSPLRDFKEHVPVPFVCLYEKHIVRVTKRIRSGEVRLG